MLVWSFLSQFLDFLDALGSGEPAVLSVTRCNLSLHVV